MKRKEFLKNGAILLSLGSVLNGCSKENAVMASSGEAAADAAQPAIQRPQKLLDHMKSISSRIQLFTGGYTGRPHRLAAGPAPPGKRGEC